MRRRIIDFKFPFTKINVTVSREYDPVFIDTINTNEIIPPSINNNNSDYNWVYKGSIISAAIHRDFPDVFYIRSNSTHGPVKHRAGAGVGRSIVECINDCGFVDPDWPPFAGVVNYIRDKTKDTPQEKIIQQAKIKKQQTLITNNGPKKEDFEEFFNTCKTATQQVIDNKGLKGEIIIRQKEAIQRCKLRYNLTKPKTARRSSKNKKHRNLATVKRLEKFKDKSHMTEVRAIMKKYPPTTYNGAYRLVTQLGLTANTITSDFILESPTMRKYLDLETTPQK